MRIALIACAVLERELSFEIAKADSVVRVWWLRQGLHDTPELLRQQLQREIDCIEMEQHTLAADKKYDAICLGYGLCSNGVLGLHAKTLPLVIPRCDDCISLFLGSSAQYYQLFQAYPGAYWYNPGWIEHAFTPSEQSYQTRFQSYVEQYGADNAAYLMEAEKEWTTGYQHCIYIESPVYQNTAYEAYAQQAAADFGWTFHKEQGDQRLVRELLAGEWDSQRFLVCLPQHTVAADYTEMKLKAQPSACVETPQDGQEKEK